MYRNFARGWGQIWAMDKRGRAEAVMCYTLGPPSPSPSPIATQFDKARPMLANPPVCH